MERASIRVMKSNGMERTMRKRNGVERAHFAEWSERRVRHRASTGCSADLRARRVRRAAGADSAYASTLSRKDKANPPLGGFAAGEEA